MNPIVIRLTAAAITHIARLAGAALADIRSRTRRAMRLGARQGRRAALRVFAVAATQKWF